jgi:NAD(P)-dependent dehydrogenase (short-subunit alcohol dehydrogenase family)
MFEVNFFGANRMIHAVLPSMRERRKGFIVTPRPSVDCDRFRRWATTTQRSSRSRNLSEALGREVEPVGIKVMLVEPSGFRTDWTGHSANESKRQIGDSVANGASRTQDRKATRKGPVGMCAAEHRLPRLRVVQPRR